MLFLLDATLVSSVEPQIDEILSFCKNNGKKFLSFASLDKGDNIEVSHVLSSLISMSKAEPNTYSIYGADCSFTFKNISSLT